MGDAIWSWPLDSRRPPSVQCESARTRNSAVLATRIQQKNVARTQIISELPKDGTLRDSETMRRSEDDRAHRLQPTKPSTRAGNAARPVHPHRLLIHYDRLEIGLLERGRALGLPPS
jgi:hypothetical protein